MFSPEQAKRTTWLRVRSRTPPPPPPACSRPRRRPPGARPPPAAPGEKISGLQGLIPCWEGAQHIFQMTQSHPKVRRKLIEGLIPPFSTILLFKNRIRFPPPFSLGFRRFSRKKDPWKEWKRKVPLELRAALLVLFVPRRVCSIVATLRVCSPFHIAWSC